MCSKYLVESGEIVLVRVDHVGVVLGVVGAHHGAPRVTRQVLHAQKEVPLGEARRLLEQAGECDEALASVALGPVGAIGRARLVSTHVHECGD